MCMRVDGWGLDRLDAELRRDSKHTGLVHGDFKSANLFENPETGEWSVVRARPTRVAAHCIAGCCI